MKSITLALSGLLLTSCASIPGAKPDDMSAKAHEAEADRHAREAKVHRADYDPSAAVWHTRSESETDAFDVLPEYYYNPTDVHMAQAQRHQLAERAHRHAAVELEAFAREECAGIKVKTRARCPLLGGVLKVTNIEGGVRFWLPEGVDPDGIVAHMRCHFAVGREAGRAGMRSCPLYLQALTIRRVGDRAVELTSSEASIVAEIRARMASHVVTETDRYDE